MKYYLILAFALFVCSCTQKKSENKNTKPAQKEQAKVITQTKERIVYVEPDDIDDIDELRDRLEEANNKIEELEHKIQNAQSSIDDARSKINWALISIDDARRTHNREMLDDAEDELDGANSELDDAESELW